MLMDNLFLASLGVLIVLTLFVLGLVLYFAAKRTDAKPTANPKIAKLRFDSLRNSFRQAVELIEGSIATRSERYSIPWVMVLNEGLESGQLPIEQSGVPSALSSETVSAVATQGIGWHFFDRGVVIDIQGAYLGSPDDNDATERPWDEFLGLCSKYRPQRPFDSVVITVPVSLLTDESADARLQLAKLAKLAHRRLWLAQNRFAMRFPVYIVVSGCDKLEGFAPFARAVPDSVRASILGWSSPYDLSTAYQASWVGDALDRVVRTLSDTCAELFALNSVSEETSKFFLLPSRVGAIRAQLQLYVDELMRPSAYHEPFFMRGIYLTGDSSESAQRALGLNPSAEDESLEVDDAEPAADMVSHMMRQPAFLRDLFEKKVFLEYGLARPSNSQQMTRPVLGRAARWAAIGVGAVWGVGLVVATVQLHSRNGELVTMLAQIQTDSDIRARADEHGIVLSPEWHRVKALGLLAAIEKLGNDHVWTLFMPGSWDAFDDLNERVSERIERAFGEIAINTVRRELYAKASDLTGVIQEPSTGELVIGGDCTIPKGFVALRDAPRRITLAVEELGEYSAVTNYLSSLENLDQAIASLNALRKPSPNEAADFRFLVKYALGADFPGNAARSIRFFRDDEIAGGATPAALSIEPIKQATQCSLKKGIAEIDRRMYEGNDLIASEGRFSGLAFKLLSPDAQPIDFKDALEGYRNLLEIIKEQESLLGPGKGSWMKHSQLATAVSAGPSYDATFARAGRIKLIGAEAVESSRRNTIAALQKFGTVFAANYTQSDQTGIVWADKEARFVVSPERIALKDALQTLLSQSFMVLPKSNELPDVPADAALFWNTSRLDQTLALGDSRKRYMTEGLPKFAPKMRTNIEGVLNAHFAKLTRDGLIDSLAVTSRADPGFSLDFTTYEATRGRLAKIAVLLGELDAQDELADLRSLISHDAAIRLKQVDDVLLRSDLYSTNVRDFKTWQGDKGRLLQAFGVHDAPSLQQYLAAQFGRVDALGKQAEVYIPALAGRAATGQVAQRWQAINKDLDRYRLKNPNSSLGGLEQFLVTSVTELERGNCLEKLVGKAPSRPVDYFAERHLQIFSGIVNRCADLNVQNQRDQWNAFSSNFNQLLAGRLPFAPQNTRTILFAEFDEVGQVLKYYEQVAKTLKEIKFDGAASAPVKGAPISLQPQVQALAPRLFIDQFDRVRSFLAPLYPTDETAVPGYDVAVEFRANQQAEVAGNKVIEWTLDMGGQILTHRDLPRVLRWEYRTPISLTLRLAKDSLITPLPDVQQPEMDADGKTVRYIFSDPWALMTMIQRQRESDTTNRDKRSNLLRLEFPTKNASENPDAPLTEGRSKVYLRLTLSPVGKRTPVAWPGSFPVKAPDWSDQ